MRKLRVGLALGGGAARGSPHVSPHQSSHWEQHDEAKPDVILDSMCPEAEETSAVGSLTDRIIWDKY